MSLKAREGWRAAHWHEMHSRFTVNDNTQKTMWNWPLGPEEAFFNSVFSFVTREKIIEQNFFILPDAVLTGRDPRYFMTLCFWDKPGPCSLTWGLRCSFWACWLGSSPSSGAFDKGRCSNRQCNWCVSGPKWVCHAEDSGGIWPKLESSCFRCGWTSCCQYWFM